VSLVTATGLAVNRLRVVDSQRDALRARLAADRLLSAAQPEVPGLPAGAILIVRRVAGQGFAAPLDSPAAAARWRGVVEDALVGLWRRAARPAIGPVPGDAPAVLFDDHADLLACLAADWAAGVAALRWWWLALLGPRVPAAKLSAGSDGVPALLRSHAREVPAVFELLARRRLAVAVARAIPAGEALSLAVAVALEHNVRGARDLPLPLRLRPRASTSDTPGSPPVQASPDPAAPPPASLGSPPWDLRVSETGAAGLAQAQRLLLGLTLAIRRDPVVARATSFWPAVETWWRQAVAGQAASAVRDATERPPAAREPRTTPPPGEKPPAPGAAAAVVPEHAEPEAEAKPSPLRAVGPGTPSPDAALPVATELAASEPGVWTSHAGVFYLLNVALFLGLYGDFTMPRERGLALDPWDFAALIGRRLLRRTADGDPIWRLLAGLAGHGWAPGVGFRAPRVWRVSPSWLEPFDRSRGPWRWAVVDDRLRVTHPAGFAALDLPVAADRREQLTRELLRYRNPRLMRGGAPPFSARGLARWSAWVACYLRARLRIALGTRSANAAVRIVLERPGTVFVTPTRVDVHFSLDDLPIAIRLAGLDRSPGWIPAAGRYLEFHFE
jgi:hypothetical protein